MSDSLIVAAIRRYYPGWEPPADTGWEWSRCLCPFHGDETPSAAVSFSREAYNCLACGVRGDAISIIRHEEEVTFFEALRIAESLPVGGDTKISTRAPRKPSRRVFAEPGDPDRASVRPGVRSRANAWT